MNSAADQFGRASMNRAKRGIYVGKQVMSGHNVSFSNRRTKRTFMPNVQTKTYYSKLLNREIKLRVTTKAMKCIKKAGNFDKFIMEKEHLTHDSEIAAKLREEMKQTLKQQPDLQANFKPKWSTKSSYY